MNIDLDEFLKGIEESVNVNFASSEVPPGLTACSTITISNGSSVPNANGDVYTSGYVQPIGSDPSSGITWITATGTGTIAYPSAAPADARVIQATPPRIEDIFVEIAKVIQKRGNISEIRDILNKHKLKVVDHDGEVIFDSEWDKKIKNQDL